MTGPIRHVMGEARGGTLEKQLLIGYKVQSGHDFGVQSRVADPGPPLLTQ